MLDREIKFRGKAEYYNDWLYGNLVQTREKGAYIFPLDAPDSVDRYSVLENTVSQYTGLKDKNGNEVYSDHILRYTETIFTDCSETEISEVRDPVLIRIINYRPLASVIKPISKGVRAHGWDQETGEGIILGDIRSEDIEIIGSIYDNPELLEGSL